MNYQELKDAALKVNETSGVLQGYYSILSIRGFELSRLDLIRIIKTLDIAVYENCSADTYNRVIKQSIENVEIDVAGEIEETFVQKIAKLSIEAAGREMSNSEVDDLINEFSDGITAHDKVCIYATKSFSVLILPDEEFKVVVRTSNWVILEVDAEYLEEAEKVIKLQQAVQVELDAVKEWI